MSARTGLLLLTVSALCVVASCAGLWTGSGVLLTIAAGIFILLCLLMLVCVLVTDGGWNTYQDRGRDADHG